MSAAAAITSLPLLVIGLGKAQRHERKSLRSIPRGPEAHLGESSFPAPDVVFMEGKRSPGGFVRPKALINGRGWERAKRRDKYLQTVDSIHK